MSTETTLTHHLGALSQGIDAVMEDYTETSVLFTPDGPIRGLAGIRSFFEAFITKSPPELIGSIALLRKDIHGETAYIIWKAEPFIPLATDTFLIQGDKIVMHSFAVLSPAQTGTQEA